MLTVSPQTSEASGAPFGHDAREGFPFTGDPSTRFLSTNPAPPSNRPTHTRRGDNEIVFDDLRHLLTSIMARLNRDSDANLEPPPQYEE